MSKFKIINLIDKLFISVSVFLIIFAWINFYIRSLWTTFILSLIFSFAVVFLLYYFFNKKQNKLIASKSNLDDINYKYFCFCLMNAEQKIELLKTILEKDFEVSIKDGILHYKSNNKTHLVIIATNYKTIDLETYIFLISNFNDYKVDYIDIICADASANLNTNIFINKQINFITKQKLYYDYFKKYNVFPIENNINKNVTKIRFGDIIKNLFTPNKAKGYFLCGLVIIFSSIILPFHVYYLVFGSTLLMFSIICKLLKFKNY